MRRTPRWPAVLAALALEVANAPPIPAAPAPPAFPQVTVNHETLQGRYGERHPQIASFRGVPYAAAPIGALRWAAPRAYRPHPGPRPAREFSAACYQDSYLTDWYRLVGAAFGRKASAFRDPPVSEDCLYLNVWTPALKPPAALPVIVWLHGGSNRSGWSFEPNYDGENLATEGVVVVTIGYRVGVFGFFSHPGLERRAPANFGLLDQIAALRWVRQHIRDFGGDRDNVTVAGESAGAADIGYLITAPLARGLFRRAISESGGYQMLEDLRLAEAEKVGRKLSGALPGNPGLAAMRKLGSAEVFAAAHRALPDHDYGPVVDGIVVQIPPAAAYRRRGLPFDLLIGSNQDEWYMYVKDDAGGLASALSELPASVRPLLAARAAQESEIRHGLDQVTTLVRMHCPVYAMATAAVHSGRHAWVYRFTRVRPGPGGKELLAYHGAEIPYVFDTHDQWLTGDDADRRLTVALTRYWSNFARTGDPNGAGLVPWPEFVDVGARVQELGSRIGALAAPDRALCEQISGTIYPGWSP
jgi:para-nitrobenzyl esterase